MILKVVEQDVEFTDEIIELLVGRAQNSSDTEVDYATEITVSRSPTHNCQLSTVGGIHYLYEGEESLSDYDKKEDILRDIFSYVPTTCVLVDLPVETVERFLDDMALAGFSEVVLKAEYTNTTARKMCLINIVVNPSFREDEEDDDFYDDDY